MSLFESIQPALVAVTLYVPGARFGKNADPEPLVSTHSVVPLSVTSTPDCPLSASSVTETRIEPSPAVSAVAGTGTSVDSCTSLLVVVAPYHHCPVTPPAQVTQTLTSNSTG